MAEASEAKKKPNVRATALMAGLIAGVVAGLVAYLFAGTVGFIVAFIIGAFTGSRATLLVNRAGEQTS